MEDIKKQAEAYAREHKKAIAKELTNTAQYPSEKSPVTIFMAGSPGAGKTEFSKNFIKLLEQEGNGAIKLIRIDGDDLRSKLPGYTGNNSNLFQGAISILVEKIQDCALEHKQSFVLDGTFSKHEKAFLNIERSLHKKRKVFVCYVYQKPEVAWKFTESREILEGRNIPKGAFIEELLDAQRTVKAVLDKYGEDVTVLIVTRNFEDPKHATSIRRVHEARQIDDLIGTTYTKEDIEKLL